MVYQSVFIARKWKNFIFTKMILQVMLKLLPILILFGASVVTTQKFFRSSKCIKFVFKTSLWNHSFATKSFRVSQMILLLLCSRTRSKSVIFMPFSYSGILPHLLTSKAYILGIWKDRLDKGFTTVKKLWSNNNFADKPHLRVSWDL